MALVGGKHHLSATFVFSITLLLVFAPVNMSRTGKVILSRILSSELIWSTQIGFHQLAPDHVGIPAQSGSYEAFGRYGIHERGDVKCSALRNWVRDEDSGIGAQAHDAALSSGCMRNFDALMSQGENEELVPNESKVVRIDASL